MGIDYGAGIQLGFKFSGDEIRNAFVSNEDPDLFHLDEETYHDVETLVDALCSQIGAVYTTCGDLCNGDYVEFVIGPKMSRGVEAGCGRFFVRGEYGVTEMIALLPASAEIERKLKKFHLDVSSGPLLHCTWWVG